MQLTSPEPSDTAFVPSESQACLNILVGEGQVDAIPQGEATIEGFSTDCECVSGKEPSCPPWRVFTSTFITIFLAELGDKTQVSTLLMSAEFHNPWVIFAGASIALITTTLLGVLVGRWLATRLSPKTLDTAAGITLALIAAWLVWDVMRM
ncbi:MAG: TMEM165/GDT1 family protein [Leptolyngbyaceae cyanobacterium RU_5_1]|nr:TMEM165/GDT1 family protein [Leptolyngbyaceae cyanobacterium RU_5_1]